MRRALDDRHPGAALDGQQGELAQEVADAARSAGLARVADDDLAARPLRGQPVEVGVVTGGDEPACPAGPAGPGPPRSGAVHSSAAARSPASVVLPTAGGPTSRTAWGARTRDHSGDGVEGRRLAAGHPARTEPRIAGPRSTS